MSRTNAKETIDNLKTLNDMGAISSQSILEHSPYTTDVVQEMERLKENQMGNEGGNNTYEEDMKPDDSGNGFGK
jgi:hypothetical protein